MSITLLAQDSSNILSLLFGPLLAETFMISAICFVLIAVSLELASGQSKAELALETLRAFRLTLLVVSAIYLFQLLAGEASTTLLEGYLLSTPFVTLLKLLLSLSGLFILHNSTSYMERHPRHLLEYSIILALAILFMLLLIGANHLIAAFLSLVGFSLNLYVLVLFDAPFSDSREAGIKYYYLSTFSSGLILYGVFLLYVLTGSCHFDAIAHQLTASSVLLAQDETMIHAALFFLLTGLCFKLSAFPGHLWAAEVYDGSPDPVTAFFMLPVKVAVLSFTMQLLIRALAPLQAYWSPIIAVIAATSMIWGCLGALVEKKTKRFLAYASINQIGFILMGLVADSAYSYRATLLYIVLYVIMNVIFLTIFLNAQQGHTQLVLSRSNSLLYLTDFRALGQRYWIYSWSLAIALFSMAGIPPLAGFFGKFYLLLHAQEQGLYGLVTVALLTSIVSTYYYLRLIKILWFESSGRIAGDDVFVEKTFVYPDFTCELSPSQRRTLIGSELLLWAFALVGGLAFPLLNSAVYSLYVF